MENGGIVEVLEGRVGEREGEGTQRIASLRPKKRGAQFRATKAFVTPRNVSCATCGRDFRSRKAENSGK